MAEPTSIINFEPDWGSPPVMEYSFQTIVQATPYIVEQRRPLILLPIRKQSCKFVFKGTPLQRARNRVLYSVSKLCCVPIYSEPISAAAISQGASSITAASDLSFLWNIQNCSYIIILDFVSGQSEMVKISSVVGQVINLMSAIVNSWTAAQSIIYPAFAGKIAAVKGSEITDDTGGMELDFEEIATPDPAVKAWVGLEEQMCQATGIIVNCGEPFNGTNGDPIPTTVFIVDSGWGANVVINDNKLRHEAVVGGSAGYQYWYRANYSFAGVFDFYISYDLLNVSNENSGWIYVEPLKNGSDGDIQFGVEWWYGGGGNVNYYGYGPVPEMDFVETSQMSGKLRFTRDAGGDIRIFYWNDALAIWEANGDPAGFLVDNFSGLFTVAFEVFSGFDEPIIDIGDYVVTSGCNNITSP